MFSIMLFIFLCFFGILAVLYHMLRSQEKLCKSLHEEHAQMRVMLRSLESRLDDLDVAAPAAVTGNGATRLAPRPASHAAAQPAEDPLLHLSFGDPAQSVSPSTPGVDPALDLHFDPAVGIPSAPHRNGRN
ncbi:MAG: hypothetical protein EOM56_05365 [Deltaproteobacteria bacterium]|nr:hypothetical protein [Deltaproteobacteria bacterium]